MATTMLGTGGSLLWILDRKSDRQDPASLLAQIRYTMRVMIWVCLKFVTVHINNRHLKQSVFDLFDNIHAWFNLSFNV